ncbi:Serine/threonine-protein kinase [Basidiobolus ranarum]|uniref:Serine/threonine-protein kinase n=1 Tax=Basidiobolus ranarum TaxID=34480 RepID=A0ABR2WA11_9FUNG
MVSKRIALSLKSASRGILRTPLGEFSVIKSLGEGSYGKVKLVMSLATKEKYAVKIIQRQIRRGAEHDTKRTKSMEKRVVREANMARLLAHPNIVTLKNFRVTDTHYYLFYEYVDGCQLAEKIGKRGLSEERAKRYFHQIVAALNDNIKLIDFGLANFYNRNAVLKTACGSLPYTAPEILRGESYVGEYGVSKLLEAKANVSIIQDLK